VIEAQSLGTFHNRNPLSAASTDPLIHDTNPLPVVCSAPFHEINPAFSSVVGRGGGGGGGVVLFFCV